MVFSSFFFIKSHKTYVAFYVSIIYQKAIIVVLVIQDGSRLQIMCWTLGGFGVIIILENDPENVLPFCGHPECSNNACVAVLF